MSKFIQIVPQQDTDTQPGALWALDDEGIIWTIERNQWIKFCYQKPEAPDEQI